MDAHLRDGDLEAKDKSAFAQGLAGRSSARACVFSVPGGMCFMDFR